MRPYRNSLLVALGAAMLLAALVGTASANNLSYSTRAFRTTWSSLEFSSEGLGTIRCAVTIEGSFHSATVRKVARALIGYITRAVVKRPCAGGNAWALSGEANEVLGGTVRNTLPWHLAYSGFTGTLPNISEVNYVSPTVGFMLRDTTFGILCEYTNSSAILVFNLIQGPLYYIWNLLHIGLASSSGGLCPRISIRGEGRGSVLGTTISMSVRLI